MTLTKSRLDSRTGAALAFGLAALGMGALVALSLSIVRADDPLVLFGVSANDKVNRLVTYQVLALLMAGVMAGVTARLVPKNFASYFRVGSLAAPAGAVRALGIKGTSTWVRLGLTFSVSISAVTGALVLLPVARDLSLTPNLVGLALLMAASNAFVEEYIARFQVVAALAGRVTAARIALICALLFGIPHYIGTPGGPVGVLAAGFLGWFLGKSVLETQGLGWAWFIHFVQDVIIFIAILGTL